MSLRHGNLDRAGSHVRALVDEIDCDPDHAPDGLGEADIDTLIADAYAEVTDRPRRPRWTSATVTDLRAARRRTNALVRTWPITDATASTVEASNALVTGVLGQGKTHVEFTDADEVA